MRRNTWLKAPSPAMVLAVIALVVGLGGTAVAATGSIVNIADGTVASQVAHVDVNGALKTTVSGTVIIAGPKTPFSFPSASFTDGGATIQFGATAATVAFTGFRVANQSSVSTTLTIYEYGETSTSCSLAPASSRFLGQFSIPAGQTVDEQLTTPQVVKPLPGSPDWCFVTFGSGGSGEALYTTYSGYVISGTFTPASSGAPTSPGAAAPSPTAPATREEVNRLLAQ